MFVNKPIKNASINQFDLQVSFSGSCFKIEQLAGGRHFGCCRFALLFAKRNELVLWHGACSDPDAEPPQAFLGGQLEL